ncbi:fasciclin [Sulfitobacter alexandrii]|uniref:Fasciclin n=1 Tax=Sulfitobacter alexandrii TaxID=1917485 RepID=A0A1J0WK25_9RHOB|nr:fasciclin domain-containing protein [Sulfitobacter alexandrii]APE44676.1 fasciclin [Sulfitobacter alexandrii]
MNKIKLTLAASAMALGATAAFAQDNPMVGGAEMFADRNIVENAVNSADHTTLVSAVQAAGLAETLSGPGPFTVFAPTNEGFDRLEDGAVTQLLEPANRDQLTQTLTCHVVDGAVTAEALTGMIEADGGQHAIPTLGGCTLTASIADDGRVLITDENDNGAFVTIPDVNQSNGIIHVIDGVMLPKQ